MANKQYKIIFTPEAINEIDLVYDYITTQLYNQEAASKIKQLIRKKVERLNDFPLSCPLINHSALADEDELRKLIINEQFLAVYTIDETNKIVYIVGLYNSSRDYIPFLIDN